jgi:CheY-like chemotaxis protein
LGVLHDVSNALTVIAGWAEEVPMGDLAAVQGALALIALEAKRAQHLARESLGVKVERHPELGHEVIEGLARSMAPLRERAQVELVIDQVPTCTVVDAAGCTRVLQNLLLNAFAHAPKGGQVKIATRRLERHLRIVVSDTGIGIPRELAHGIFEGISTRDGGAGVGLATGRELARKRGGELALVSVDASMAEAQTRIPARFELFWPLVPESLPSSVSSMTVAASAPAQRLFGKRVLLVEDDAGVAGLLETALDARGACVTIVGTMEAIQAWQGEADLVLLDWSPVHGREAEAYAHLSARAPNVILSTGSGDGIPEVIAHCPLLRKPFTVSEALQVIEAALA